MTDLPKSDRMPDAGEYPPSTVEVTGMEMREDGKVAISMTMLVDANRLVELTSHMIKMGVTSWSDYLTKKK